MADLSSWHSAVQLGTSEAWWAYMCINVLVSMYVRACVCMLTFVCVCILKVNKSHFKVSLILQSVVSTCVDQVENKKQSGSHLFLAFNLRLVSSFDYPLPEDFSYCDESQDSYWYVVIYYTVLFSYQRQCYSWTWWSHKCSCMCQLTDQARQMRWWKCSSKASNCRVRVRSLPPTQLLIQ